MMTLQSSNLKQTISYNIHKMTESIVIDIGTGLTKAGLSAEDAPRSQFPTVVGKPKLPSIMVGMEHRDSYIGEDAYEKQNVLYLKNPIKHGFVQNWQDMQQILHHIYYSELRVTPQEHPCLIAQSPKNPPASRHKLAQIMFESINVPKFYLSNQSVLGLFATGRTTGLVVDCGAGVTSAVPIYEGYAVPHAIKRNNFAGNDLDSFLIEKIQKQKNIKLNHHTDYKSLLQIKSRITICESKSEYISSKNTIAKSNKNNEENGFVLPDGNWLDVSEISTECGEIFFDPATFVGHQKFNSIQALVKSAIDACDKDIRRDLSQSIVTSGGSSNLNNFGLRLQEEMGKLYSSESITLIEKEQREFLPWVGGSILSSLSSFQTMWVSKEEYQQNGLNIIDKKCF